MEVLNQEHEKSFNLRYFYRVIHTVSAKPLHLWFKSEHYV
jgi:hypothetical protein